MMPGHKAFSLKAVWTWNVDLWWQKSVYFWRQKLYVSPCEWKGCALQPSVRTLVDNGGEEIRIRVIFCFGKLTVESVVCCLVFFLTGRTQPDEKSIQSAPKQHTRDTTTQGTRWRQYFFHFRIKYFFYLTDSHNIGVPMVSREQRWISFSYPKFMTLELTKFCTSCTGNIPTQTVLQAQHRSKDSKSPLQIYSSELKEICVGALDETVSVNTLRYCHYDVVFSVTCAVAYMK